VDPNEALRRAVGGSIHQALTRTVSPTLSADIALRRLGQPSPSVQRALRELAAPSSPLQESLRRLSEDTLSGQRALARLAQPSPSVQQTLRNLTEPSIALQRAVRRWSEPATWTRLATSAHGLASELDAPAREDAASFQVVGKSHHDPNQEVPLATLLASIPRPLKRPCLSRH